MNTIDATDFIPWELLVLATLIFRRLYKITRVSLTLKFCIGTENRQPQFYLVHLHLPACAGLMESRSSIFGGFNLSVPMNVNLQEIKSDIQRIEQIDSTSTSYNDPDTLEFVKAIAEKYTADWRQKEFAFKYDFQVRLSGHVRLESVSKITVCASQDTVTLSGYISELKM